MLKTITPTPRPKCIIIVILRFVIINKEHKMHKTAGAFIELSSTLELWSAAQASQHHYWTVEVVVAPLACTIISVFVLSPVENIPIGSV